MTMGSERTADQRAGMRRSRRDFGRAVAAVGMAVVLAVLAPVTHSAASTGPQHVAVPSYIYPGSSDAWNRLSQAGLSNGGPVGIVIVNPASGPGTALNAAYLGVVQNAQAAGITVLGYVYTGYGSRARGSVQNDISKYAQWYKPNGIFFDQASTDCGKTTYYGDLGTFARKTLGPSTRVVLNPGTQTNECYMAVADTVVNAETSYASYTTTYTSPAWVAGYPASRFWHLVYGAPDTTALSNAIALSKARNAGNVYVTNDVPPNPWDTVPSGDYWTQELSGAASQ